MLICLDVGNTNICLGVFKGRELHREFRIRTNREATADELSLVLAGFLNKIDSGHNWKGVIVASVVPELDRSLRRALQTVVGIQPLQVDAEMALPVKNLYTPRRAVGTDRLVNAVAAVEEFGAPVIVADFGTAVTVDAVSARKGYLGGAILPGLNLANESLAQNTSLLARVELRKPAGFLGRSTEASMRAGILLGTAGAVAFLIKGMKRELGGKVKVVATGGMAELVVPECPEIKQVRPHLTLEGLRIIWDYTRRGRKK